MGLREKLEANAYAVRENVYRSMMGKKLLRLRCREFLMDLPYAALSRTDLMETLFKALSTDTTVLFSKEVVEINDTEDRVFFA